MCMLVLICLAVNILRLSPDESVNPDQLYIIVCRYMPNCNCLCLVYKIIKLYIQMKMTMNHKTRHKELYSYAYCFSYGPRFALVCSQS